MGLFKRDKNNDWRSKQKNNHPEDGTTEAMEMKKNSQSSNNHDNSSDGILPTRETPATNHNGDKVTRGIQPEGESGRSGFHPFNFAKIVWRSTSRASRICNILWPVVPAAIAITYTRKEDHVLIFTLNYIAMVPCANLIGFAGQELARKMHKVYGVLLETTLGSVVEIIMFMVLLVKEEYQVIQAAILGSILATQLLCLGMCFFVGGMRHDEQVFDEVIGEVGSDLLLTAGFGLIIPAAFSMAVTADGSKPPLEVEHATLQVSRITSVLLILSYALYVFFQSRTHVGIYDSIFAADEERDKDKHKDLRKAKLTLTECLIALAVAITLVTIIAISLVEQIKYMVEEHRVTDAFIGLILVPLVEKFAEHLTAIDEAWDNQMNMALAHVLGATIQTSLFNGPLAVIVSWGLGKKLDLNFQLFNIVVLILAILVVGNFLRDQKSNYLEGALCVITYVIIAVAAYYYPDATEHVTDVRERSAGIIGAVMGRS